MLNRTFVHLPGVGYATEARWWRQGIHDWDTFLTRDAGRPSYYVERIAESRERLAARDHAFFSQALASRDQWRAVPDFADAVGYLDIETTGGTNGEDVTVIGLASADAMRVFVKGRDLEAFPRAIASCRLLVTFFGTGFDLPMLRRRFPELPFDQIHVDLCYALRRLGYRGGLKKVEADLGIARSEETQGLSGWDAVRLWQAYRQGSAEALELLLRYNQEDVLNMRALMAFAYDRLSRQALAGAEGEEGAPRCP